jgi:hypothetical protein
MKNKYTQEELMDLTEVWLTTGELDTNMLAEGFQFISPFWKSNDKNDFINTFQKSSDYQDNALSKITKFDPLLKFKGVDEKYFAIVLQYHTKNGCSVYETVLGTVENGLLVELRSIYDLAATKKALQLA